MSDEELDKVFKNAAEGFRADIDKSGWKDMEAKLDQSNRKVWYKSKLNYVLLACLFGGSSIVFWYASTRKEYAEAYVEIKQTIEPSSAIVLENTDIIKQSSEDRMQKQEPDIGSSIAKRRTPQTALIENTDPSDYLKNEGFKADDQTSLTSTPFSENNYITQQKDTRMVSSPGTSAKMDTVAVAQFKEQDDDKSNPSDSGVSELPQERGIESVYRFSIKVSIAPDFSSTELFNQGKPGLDMGIAFGYNFNSHWSVYTGAILSRKVYSSTNLEASYTASGYKYPIDKLYGDCRILDIPLNVYYSFNQHRALSYKVGVGFSSYLMFSEEYTYFVDKPYGSAEYHLRVENENNEWFKMLNLSLVLQKRLNNNFFLEVEPFVKLPLAGIGAGDISLYTVGGFLSLRYDFYKRKEN